MRRGFYVQRRGLSAEMIMKHTMKVYKNSPDHSAYLAARFDKEKTGQSFEFAGHRWAYDTTSFDDAGDYDQLFRFDDEPYPEEVTATTEDLTIRDYFATSAMQALLSGDPCGRFDATAKDAYLVAEAMLRAREAS